MTGAQRRSAPVAFSATPAMATMVTRAVSGAAGAGPPAGTSVSIPKTTGITVTGSSMTTVPTTVGVRIRRNSESLAESANWQSEAMMTRVASSAGPPRRSPGRRPRMKAPELPPTRR